jgi:hypothetical protein
VDAAEHHVLGDGVVGRQPRQPERVAPGVGPPHDFVALVMVAEDEQPLAEVGLGFLDPAGELVP